MRSKARSRELPGTVPLKSSCNSISNDRAIRSIVSLVLARCHCTPADALRWLVRFEAGLAPDVTIVVRMNQDNRSVLDYYLLPSIDIPADRLRIKEDNGTVFDGYRFDSLEYFFGIVQTVKAGATA